MQKYRIAGTKAVTRLTAFYRMRRERRKYLKTKADVIRLQANTRYFLAMAAFIRFKHCRDIAHLFFEQGWRKIEETKAIMIQKHWKGYVVRRRYKKCL